MRYIMRKICLFPVMIAVIVFTGCGQKKNEDPVTVTLWHVYGGQTESPLNDLIDEFNETIGKEKNIRVQVGSVTNTNTIHENVLASAFGDPGASKLPDMFVSYPKTVLAMPDDTELVDYYDYFTEEELKNNPVFNQIYDRSQEMKEFVDGYNDAITELNKNVAQQQTLTALKGTELPDTEEEFDTFRDNLIKTAQSSDEFIGSQEDIENAINSYLSTVPQFSSYYGDLSSAVENTTETIKQSQEAIQTEQRSLEQILGDYPELVKMATVGKLDEDVLTSTDKYADLLAEVGLSADSSSSDVKKFVEQIQAIADDNPIDNLKAVSDDFESLTDAYDTLMNKKEMLSIDQLDNVQNVFGDLSTFDDFVAKATDAKATTEELQAAFDNMATEYCNNSEKMQSYPFFEHGIYNIELPNFFTKNFLTLNNTAKMLIRYIDIIHKFYGGIHIDTFKCRYRLGANECPGFS